METFVKRIRIEDIISISPEHIQTIKKEIYAILRRKLLKWDVKIQGSMIRFENLKIISKLSEIRNESPMLNIKVKYDAEYFFAEAGTTLAGRIINFNSNFIGLKVYNTFKALISIEAINHAKRVSLLDDDEAGEDESMGKNENGKKKKNAEESNEIENPGNEENNEEKKEVRLNNKLRINGERFIYDLKRGDSITFTVTSSSSTSDKKLLILGEIDYDNVNIL